MILLWSLASPFTLLLNAAAGPILSTPDALLAIWVLLLLPLAVRRPDGRESVEEEPLPLVPRR